MIANHTKDGFSTVTLFAALLASSLSSHLVAQGPRVDFHPTTREVVLNTEKGLVLTSIGWVTVTGGVYVFRNITIPAGTTVRGEGKNPLILIASRDVKLDGTLSVRGGDGSSVQTLNSANFPEKGGEAVCGGGDGGAGSPVANDRSFTGGTGFGPLQMPSFGGRGGRINCANAVCGIGSAGGGGVFATAGDPWYPLAATAYFVQPTGTGGYGCVGRVSTVLPGGSAGNAVFTDQDPGNNFFGLGYDVNRRRLVLGELPMLAGGSGGGGGGDLANSCAARDPNFVNDEKGGGGGAGGGCVAVIAEGTIQIGLEGRVNADGGHGGGGAWAGSSNRSGGGGGGSGGLVVLYARRAIDITVHGETFAKGDHDFAISADGGISTLAPYSGGGSVRAKYPPTTVVNMSANPSGGFGGMGIIQLMAPPLNPIPDGTNTLLDDNILLRLPNGTLLRGAEKQRYLAWRGFPDAQGRWVDDQGRVIDTSAREGDFRPAPVLLPVF